MSRLAKLQYRMAILDRYRQAGRQEKARILSEFCSVCGYNRKYAIRLLNEPIRVRRARPGRRAIYGEQVRQLLTEFWHALGRICSKRIHAALPEWVLAYEESRGRLPGDLRALLLGKSPATMDRILKPIRQTWTKGKSATRPSKWWYRAHIPIRPVDLDVKAPGYFQTDTVVHCGETLMGEYASSLTVTDLASTWTESRALWRRTGDGIVQAMSKIESSLPFPVTHIKSDSGTEFLNGAVYQYLTERENPIQLFRSRPYHKNDQCFIEQKNFTHVRSVFGYERIEDESLLELMNEIYRDYWNPLQNFFTPTFKLRRKWKDGKKTIREFDQIQTPYQGLMDSPYLDEISKEKLLAAKANLNPFELRMRLEIKLKEFTERLRASKTVRIAA